MVAARRDLSVLQCLSLGATCCGHMLSNAHLQVAVLPSTRLKDAVASRQSAQDSISSALSATFPALTAQAARGPKKDARATRQAIMEYDVLKIQIKPAYETCRLQYESWHLPPVLCTIYNVFS